MSIAVTEKIALKLRGLPVGRIEKAMGLAQAAGITLSHHDVSAHLLCGRAIEPVIEALCLAKREGVSTSWRELCAIDLASPGQKYDVLSAVRACMEVRDFVFSTFASDLKEKLVGICRDATRVFGECLVRYRLPLSHVFALRLDFLQERLATRIAALIFDAPSPTRLQMLRSEHEGSLLVLAQSIMATVQKVELKYDAA